MSQGRSQNARNGSKRTTDDPEQRPSKSKRSRYAMKACHECKRRKVKCDGEDPCERCSAQLTECSYPPRPHTNSVPDWSEFQRMGAEMHSMRESLDRVVNKLTPRSASEIPAFNAIAVPEGVNHRIHSPSNTPPDTIADHITTTSTSGSPPCRGPTSAGFAFDVARESLQAIGLNPVESAAPSCEDELDLSANPRHLRGDYGHFKKLLMRDPLWQMDRRNVFRLINVFADGPGAMYPIVDIDKLRSRWDSLYSMMTCARTSRNTEKFLLAAEIMCNHETNVLKLVLANSLTSESGGINETAQRLFDSTEGAYQSSCWESPNLGNIILLALVSLLYYHLDDEVRAGRAISVAARLCLELGLNRRETFQRKVIDEHDQSAAATLFWSVCMLDRRSCTGIGVPFVMQDSDIDPSLPRPHSKHLYLDAMIEFTRIAGNACRRTSHLRDRSIPFPVDDVDYLDYQVLRWQKQIPPALTLDPNELQVNQQQQIEKQKPASLFLAAVLVARTNQLRNLIYRPVLYSSMRIGENKKHAQIAVDIARESVQFLSLLHRTTSFVSDEPVFFKHFLISALAAILLAVANAPGDFSNEVCDEFYMALDLFRSLSSRSIIMARIWNTIKIFETTGPKIGLTRVVPDNNDGDNNTHRNNDTHFQPTNNHTGNGNMPIRIEQAAAGTSPPSSWYPAEPDGGAAALLDPKGAPFSTSSFPAQLRNELLNFSEPLGDISPNLFDCALFENPDTSTYWQ